MFLFTGNVPELQTEPIWIAFHLAGEFTTAALLIAGGCGLLTLRTWGYHVFLLALGMLLYTIIVSPGTSVSWASGSSCLCSRCWWC